MSSTYAIEVRQEEEKEKEKEAFVEAIVDCVSIYSSKSSSLSSNRNSNKEEEEVYVMADIIKDRGPTEQVIYVVADNVDQEPTNYTEAINSLLKTIRECVTCMFSCMCSPCRCMFSCINDCLNCCMTTRCGEFCMWILFLCCIIALPLTLALTIKSSHSSPPTFMPTTNFTNYNSSHYKQ